MKNYILKSITLMSFLGLLLVGCNNTPKAKEGELEDAKEDVVQAESDLQQSKLDSVSDYTTFKTSIDLKLDENERQIAAMKATINSSKDSNKPEYEKQLAQLEEKNTKLKTKIQDYDQQGTSEKWELFKVEFNKDMDDLGKSISNMADRNMKK
jgi:predicted RNase H-like nuclease (RuvC/YqgF family)